MTQEDLIRELKRLAAIMPNAIAGLSRGEQQTHVDELMRKYSWLTSREFSDVVTWLLDHHNTRSLPTIAEYAKAVEAVRSRGRIEEREKCLGCAGTGFVRDIVRREHNGAIVEGLKTCRQCGPIDSELKRGFIPIIEPDSEEIRMAKRLTPQGARLALEKGEKLNVKWSEEVILILLKKAGEEPKEIKAPKPVQTLIAKEIAQVQPPKAFRLAH